MGNSAWEYWDVLGKITFMGQGVSGNLFAESWVMSETQIHCTIMFLERSIFSAVHAVMSSIYLSIIHDLFPPFQ
jgi:hypothetical protein